MNDSSYIVTCTVLPYLRDYAESTNPRDVLIPADAIGAPSAPRPVFSVSTFHPPQSVSVRDRAVIATDTERGLPQEQRRGLKIQAGKIIPDTIDDCEASVKDR
ncbi:hypothetical protein EVAR_62613_1 [Eumeta japonica]|uniref:Uncharacterized protein n=1 Tax=Eumeta variegata TaxID=151549 RepID=A0A4C1ZAM7_EUMVA|nr:hypothetical protein EVAR_62613_1 [Eumeta japonica]